ncbi:MAG: hypothetical protein N4A48_03620 [Tepidibacter sp.]|uniref:hypothetical protein n=1 Tax=Tepidibacter sp. TaxID=2529387 RepID=UPI0025FE1F29|nr:hypothetical protein [Tepidibacter sp.]MCT4507837.1 hypothetical protein [Tepidibacter sp.]
MKFTDNTFDLIGETKHRLRDKEIFLMEESLKKYCAHDLIREKILLESKLEKMKKNKFYDKYILPILIVVLGSILTFVNTMFGLVLKTDNAFEYLGDIFKYYFIYIFIFSSPIIFCCMLYQFITLDTPEHIKMKLLIVESLLEANNPSISEICIAN